MNSSYNNLSLTTLPPSLPFSLPPSIHPSLPPSIPPFLPPYLPATPSAFTCSPPLKKSPTGSRPVPDTRIGEGGSEGWREGRAISVTTILARVRVPVDG